MIVKRDIFIFLDFVLQQELLTANSFQIVLRKPLEGGVRLRHKGGSADSYSAATLAGYLEIFVLHLTRKISNRQNILVRFIRQANHEVQLHAAPAGFKGRTDSVHEVLLCNALVDNIAHLLAACLRCEGQTALAHSLHLLGDSYAEAVDTQRGQRNAHAVVLKLANHIMYERCQAGIIGAGKRNQADFVIAGIVDQLTRQIHEHLRLALAYRTINHACMTEAAATAAATENLQHNAVMHNFAKGHNRRSREINAVHILNNALFNYCRNILTQRLNGLEGSVLIIFSCIEGGHINTLDFSNTLQELLASARLALALPCLIAAHNLDENLLALADNSKVEEVCQRLRIINAGTADDNEGVVIFTLCLQQRYAAQVEHI